MAADFIAVIEVGSERINGVAGIKNAKGSLDIKAAVSADASSFVDRGVVYNLNQASECFTSIVRNLENALHTHVEKVYTGVCGQSLHTITNSITRTLTSPTEISKELVESIADQNHDSFHREDWELLDTVPQEYRAGGFEKVDPVGIIDSRIEGHFLNIIARRELKKNLEDSFRKANIQLAGVYISPLLLAKAMLLDNEQRSGVALVDFQYDTTTIAVYQRNILRHLAVLPLGEKNVIIDIVNTFNTDDAEARDLLWKYGNAYTEDIEADDKKVIARSDGSTINRKNFNETVEARIQELIANIWQQLDVSGLGENLLRSGIVFTGSGSTFRNMDKAFQQYKKSEIKVRIQKNLLVPVTDFSHQLNNNSNSALSILLGGKENCAGESLEKGLFGNAEVGGKKEDSHTPNPEESKRQLEAERREKEFQLACEETRKLIGEDQFKEAQKQIDELNEEYPEKAEQISSIQTALKLRKKNKKPRLFQKWGVKLNKLKEQGKGFVNSVLEPEK